MSHNSNTQLIEEANSYLTGDLSGTPLEGMIEADLDANDLDMLWSHIMDARDMLRDE